MTIDRLQKRRHDKGTATIFVTHGINPVLDVVSRVLYLAPHGHVLGSVEEVMRTEVLSEPYGASVKVLNVDGSIIVARWVLSLSSPLPRTRDRTTPGSRR